MASLNQFLQRGAGIARHSARRGERLARAGFSQANGLVQRVTHLRPSPKDLDDVTLARKVETVIFRPENAPKGKIDVNAVDGVVWLRGEVKNPATSKKIESQARAIPEVRDVENLLHLPKTPARSAKAPTTKSSRPRRITGSVNAEKTTTPKAERSPAAKAATRSGREPAPLGTDEPGQSSGTS